MNGHVRVGGDDLLLRGQIGALLELEVANGTGQGKVAVDTTEVDEATSGADSCLLTFCKVSTANTMATERDEPSFWGLWSKERGFALPFTPSTVLESPAFP